MLVLPRSSDSAQRLYYYLSELKRIGAAPLPEVLLYDLLHTPSASSAGYNLARTRELKAALERLGGGATTQDALAREIAATNRTRGALRSLTELRRARPSRVSGEQALQAFAAAETLAADAFEAALNEALAESLAAPPSQRQGARVVVAGSALDSLGLHRLIADLGGAVVGDHHVNGELALGPTVAGKGDPLAALAEHYHRRIVSSRSFPTRPEALVDFARAAGADGVVFYFYAEEEALTWEYPAQRRALEAAGLGVLGFSLQPYDPDPAPLREPLARFLAAIGSPAHG